MKKILLTLFAMAITASSWAVRVNPQPAQITQKDGTVITVYGHGDEHYSWYTLADGTLLCHVGSDFYVANINDKGELSPSKILAHEPAQRSAAEMALVKAQPKERFSRMIEAMAKETALRKTSLGTRATYFPHSGQPKALVILVNFADTTFSLPNPKASFDDYFNAAGRPKNLGNGESQNYGSVAQYFSDMSFGQFKPQFDLVGPVTLSRSLAYYGQDGSTHDIHLNDMMKEACTLVDDSVNFADYDQDGDGKVDLVYFVYAGYSQSFTQNSSDCIWPQMGRGTVGTFDGKVVNLYGVSNELNGYPGAFSKAPLKRINGIGLFCHEFSHTMGLPDIYPTISSAYADNQAMEYWDLMDGGEYLYNGHYPTPYTPWEREAMGWMSIDTLQEAQIVRLTPIADGGKPYKILSQDPNQYLIVENIQNTGWNTKQYGHGMLVYRVNYPYQTVNYDDSPNNTKGRPSITIVPADSVLMTSANVKTAEDRQAYLKSLAGDPFPGTSNVTELTNVQLQNLTLTDKPIYDIEEKDGIVTFKFINKDLVDAIQEVNAPEATGRVYNLNGTYVGESLKDLPAGIYIKDKKKVIVR